MWMVGMKNGVKVWNRVPTELAGEMNAPLQKDEPVMQENAPVEDEAGPSEVPPAPKKKAAPRKKATVVNEDGEAVAPAPKKKAAPKKKPTPEPVEETVANEGAEEAAPVEEPAPKPKKKAAPRKKSVTPKPDEENDEENSVQGDKKEKKTRKPTDFNLFMKYHMMQLAKEIPHKEKFQMAAKAWKELDADAKKEVMVKVHAELGM